jgi:hypothetical protein
MTIAAIWKQHRFKILAVAVVALLAWVAYYLEHVPVARPFGDDDSELVRISRDKAVRLGGLSAGDVGTFRLIPGNRLTVTLPAAATMNSPKMRPFLARASRDQAALAGISCGEDQLVVDAHTGPNENATAGVALAEIGSQSDRRAALFLEKADPNRYADGVRLRALGANLKLTIDLNSSSDSAPKGRMILCRSGVATTLGHAEFELSPGQAFVAEFVGSEPGANPSSAAAFDVQGPDSTLEADSIAFGRLRRDGGFEPERIACGTLKRGVLWREPLSRIGFSDCSPGSISITGLNLATGKLSVSESSAFFSNFRDEEDSAHFVSRATKNPVVQVLIGVLLSGTIVPWAVGQFKKRRARKKKGLGHKRKTAPAQSMPTRQPPA